MLIPTLLLDVLALVGGQVHTLAPGAEPFAGTVLIEDGRLLAVGPELEIPEGARRIDCTGLHVIPGLIDGLAYHDPEHDLLYTAAGVTLLVDHGNDAARILERKELRLRDKALGPALHVSGGVLDGMPPTTASAIVLKDVNEAQHTIPVLVGDGIDFLAYQIQLGPPVWREMHRLADINEVQVWGPLPRGLTLDELLAARQEGLLFMDALVPEGASWERLRPEQLTERFAALKNAGTRVIPLLRGIVRLGAAPEDDSPDLGWLGPQHAGQWRSDAAQRRPALDETLAARIAAVSAAQGATVRALHEAGVHLVPGSGAPHPWLMPGRGLREELSTWQAAGIPAPELLALATRGAAQAFGLGDERGTLEPGKIADVVLLRADPLADVAALDEVEAVVLRGRLIDRDELDRRLVELVGELSAARAESEKPLPVAAPDVPGGALLMSGATETKNAGGRLSAERWAVVREPDDTLTFVGRALTPGGAKDSDVHVQVVQKLRKKRLEEFSVVVESGGHQLEVKGVWTAGQMRVQRRFDGLHVDTKAARETIVAVDVESVTTLILLAHVKDGGAFPVLRFHEGLELEVVRWELKVEDDGQHTLRTPGGGKLARFEENGALLVAVEQKGNGLVQTEATEIETYGGPGLPLSADKLARMRAAAKAAEAAADRPPEDPVGPPVEEPVEDPVDKGGSGGGG